MTVCFKDYREHLEESGLSDMDALMRTLEEGDKVCMAEKGHAGEHEFVDEDEVELTYVPREFPAPAQSATAEGGRCAATPGMRDRERLGDR